MNRKIYLAAAVCLLCLSQAQAQTQNNFDINAGNVTITANGTYTISGDGSTTHTIKVNPGVRADITLDYVEIDASGITNACAFDMSGATVTLRLSGANTLKSGANAAGLHAPAGATLTITSASGDGSTRGTLSATGGDGGAGIGGGHLGGGGVITISGGTVNATAGEYAAGIGGGDGWGGSGSGGIINISGGTVNATGGNGADGGAGIGGGWGGSGGTISIAGGTVNATGSRSSAGIGGGCDGPGGGTISITGGTVNATGGYLGAGIGGGNADAGIGGDITISGGTVNATGGFAGAGIGGGHQGDGGNINISGGFVTAFSPGGTGDAAAIGGGAFGNAGTVAITGGCVVALNHTGAGIGSGASNTNGSISISGGTVIATGRGIGFDDGGSTATTITGAPIIFATAVNGATSTPGNGIARGDNVLIESSDNGGTITLHTAFTVPAGATLTIPAGWTLNHTGYALTPNGEIIVNGSIVPPLQSLSYTVSYNMNGHGTQIASMIGVIAGTTVLQPTAPTAEGYTFGGWYKDSGCTNPWNFSTDVISGTTTLYAKWTAVPTVPSVPVIGVSLNKETLDVSVGRSDTLIATVSPLDATNRSVTWVKSGDAITIEPHNDTCIVTGVSVGTAFVLVVTENGGEAAHCVVTVSKAPQNITGFPPANTSLLTGEEINLSATGGASGNPVTYESSNPAVARIANNKIIAVGAGSATITANQAGNDNYDPAESVSFTLTVNPGVVSVTSVLLNKQTLDLSVGRSDTLIATVFPLDATNRSITWEKSGTGVSIVHLSDTSYIITGTSAGSTAVIMVRTADGSKTDFCVITVSAAGSKKSQSIIDFYSSNITKPFSTTGAFILQQAHATSGLPVSYIIENPSDNLVAELLQMGDDFIVIPRNIGTATIIAHQDGNNEYFAAESVSIMLTFELQSDISTVDESSSVTVRFSDGILSINSPVAERIKVYTLSGELLDKVSKSAGEASFSIPNSEQILIVKGSSGWSKKVKQE